MLATDDVAEMFAAMRTAYGPQWKHGAAAMPVWRNAMADFSAPDIMIAANRAMSVHVKHPPTLPEFLLLLRGPEPRANTYLPAPRKRPVELTANRALLYVVLNVPGIHSGAMKHMVELKNALVEDHGDDKPTKAFLENLTEELTALAKNTRDEEKCGAEAERARERFRRTGRAVA